MNNSSSLMTDVGFGRRDSQLSGLVPRDTVLVAGRRGKRLARDAKIRNPAAIFTPTPVLRGFMASLNT